MSEENKIPQLTTERLTLRAFNLSDASEVQRQAGSSKVAAMTALIPHPYPDGAAESWISTHADNFEKGLSITWAITLTATTQLIGCISLGIYKPHQKAEVGYWLGEEFWSRGYCTEATKASIDYAFNVLNLNKITSRYLAHNPASGKVMEKAGMTKEGHLKEEYLKDGRFCDMIVYGLLSPRFTVPATPVATNKAH